MPNEGRYVFSSFSGGVNTTSDPESLAPNEIRRAENAREYIRGGITKRAGSQRIHDTSLGAAVNGIFQWDAPGQLRQVVATAGGNFYWKNESDTEFTEVSASISTTYRPEFMLHHENGVPVLYFVDGLNYYKWDGSVLTEVTSYLDDPLTISRYKSRAFLTKDDKFLDYTAVDSPEDFSQLSGGGTAGIETYDTRGLVNTFVVGDSLLCCKDNSVARFTLYDHQIPTIDQGTDGISADVGLISRDGWTVFENRAMIVSDRGPYILTDQGAFEAGSKIEFDFDSNTNALAVHNRRKREVWIFTDPDTFWMYNYRTASWWGPSAFSFGVTSACRAELSTGAETVFVGGEDGFVRDADIGELDDIYRDGSTANASRIVMKVVLPSQYFGDPSAIKRGSHHQFIRAVLGVSGRLQVVAESEMGSWTADTNSYGPREHDYRIRPYFRGRAIDFTLIEDSPQNGCIKSVDLRARVGSRTG